MHIYHKNNIEYPSVTTILSILESGQDLVKWANIMGYKKRNVDEIRDKAAQFGTLVHSHLQHIVDETLHDEPIRPQDPFEKHDLQKTIDRFRQTMKEYNLKTIYTEKTLFHDEYGYAGTLDWFAEAPYQKTVLIDFKTSKKPYEKYLLQLGGYAELIHFNEGYYPDYGIILITNKDNCCPYPINGECLKEFAKIFKLLAEFYFARYNYKEQYDFSIMNNLKKTAEVSVEKKGE